MKTSIFTLLLIFSLCLNAQTKYSYVSEDFIVFHENISSAERMFKNDSLLQAYAKYDNAFSSYKGNVNPGHYFKAALCAIRIKEEFKALSFLEKAIVNGFEIDSAKRELVSFYNQNTKKEFLENFSKWQEQSDLERNKEWQAELLATAEANKKYASTKYTSAMEFCAACMKNKACSKTSPDYLSKYKVVKEKMKADSVTAVALISKIQTQGFPSVKLVGKKGSDVARNILLNYDADRKNERLDGMLSKALLDGNISPEFYATLIDRRNTMNGLMPEFYEPVIGYEKTIGKDVAVANKKRRTIGLYPIKIVSSAAQKGKDTGAAKSTYVGLYDY